MDEAKAIKYRAFLSYSHADTSWAKWLHRSLESYKVPRDFDVAASLMNESRALRPIFRDREEFSGGSELAQATIEAIDASASLVVLCSPASAKSKYVNEEVRRFKSRHPSRPVIPVILAGDAADSFPPTLRFDISSDGTLSDRPLSILAADVQEQGDGKLLALAKVIAGLTGLRTDDIARRAERDRRRRLRIWIGGLLAIATSLAGLAVWAEVNRKQAVADRNRALLTQSRYLTDVSTQYLAAGDAVSAMATAIEALPADRTAEDRPYTPEAEAALFAAGRQRREVLVFTHVQNKINQVRFSPDGNHIVVAGDNEPRILSVSDPTAVTLLKGRTEKVYTAAFSADGRQILTADSEGSARLWNAQSGAPLSTLSGKLTELSSAVFNRQSTRIATGHAGIIVWDASTGHALTRIKGTRADKVAFSPDSTRIVATTGRTAEIYDTQTGEKLIELKGHAGIVVSAEFSPDGLYIVTASHDKTMRIWEAASGRTVHVLRGHKDGLSSALYSPDGSHILSSSWDGTARIWDVGKGTVELVLRGHEGGVVSADFSADGRQVVTGGYRDRTVRVWSAAPVNGDKVIKAHEASVSSVAISPDGKLAATASRDSTARIWRMPSGELLATLKRHTGTILSITFNASSNLVVTASADLTARVWNVQNGKLVKTLIGHRAALSGAVFTPDGQRVLTASLDKTARVWDIASGKQVRVISGHEAEIWGIAVDRAGLRAATISSDETVRVWSLASGQQEALLRGVRGTIGSNAFSPDGSRLIFTTTGQAQIWTIATGNLVSLVDRGNTVASAGFSPNGSEVITSSGDQSVRLWDIETAKPRAVINNYGAGVGEAAISPDGRWIVAGTSEGFLRFSPRQTLRDLVRASKQAIPRCLSRRQRVKIFLDPVPPSWCVEAHKAPYQSNEWRQWLATNQTNGDGQPPPAADWQ